MRNWQMATVLALAIVLGAQPEMAVATEQVPYTVERTLESGVEIRRYEETVIAETVIEADSYAEAGNEGCVRSPPIWPRLPPPSPPTDDVAVVFTPLCVSTASAAR